MGGKKRQQGKQQQRDRSDRHQDDPEHPILLLEMIHILILHEYRIKYRGGINLANLAIDRPRELDIMLNMGVDIKESPQEIPPHIAASLNPRLTTAYHDRGMNWEFRLVALSRPVFRVITDVEGLFERSQRWSPEAVATTIGQVSYVGHTATSIGLDIVMHARGKVPVRRTGVFWQRRLLDIESTIDHGRRPPLPVVTSWGLFAHEAYVYSNAASQLPELGPFRPKRDPQQDAETPYFLDGIVFHPFYYTSPDRPSIIAGEDTSRMIVHLSLGDTREPVQQKITEMVANRGARLAELERMQQRIAQEIIDLRVLPDGELAGEERRFLASLNRRPDPFATLRAPDA